MKVPGDPDTPDLPPRRLDQRVVAEAGFAYGAVGADIHVFGDGTPVYLLQNWRPEDPADGGWLRELPSRMLNARWEVVGFTGRSGELAALRSWCADGPRLAVRWLHGPGGQGKTRLAAQLAREVAAEGWKTVTASEGPGTVLPPPGSQDLRLDGAAGLLLLVDYADRWPLSHLTWLLSNALLHHPTVPARVVMIARDTGPWPAVRAALANHRAGTSSQALAELAALDERAEKAEGDDPAGLRGRMFLAARDGFAARYPYQVPSGETAPPPWLDGPEFGLTLAVHMAALVSVDAMVTGRRTPTDMAGLTLYLLDREHLHWARRQRDGTHRIGGRESPGPAWTTPPEVMNRVVFTATLTGPLTPPAGAEVIGHLGLALPADRVLADHASCYPPAGPARATVLEPLHPDRLAEDFSALTLPGHLADYPAGAWAPHILRLLTEGLPPPGWTRRSVNLLAAAADRWPHVGTEHLFPLLRERPELAVEAGSSALSALAALPGAPLDLLEAVESCLPGHELTDLAPGVADLAGALARRRLARTDDPATRAAIHARLAVALTGAGRYRENLAALQEAAALYRPLVRADPEAFEAKFALVLTNLGTRLGRYGRQQEALAVSREAVDIAGRIGWLDADAPMSAGGALLVNLAGRLRAAGRTAEALATEHRAFGIFWQLSRTDPAEDIHLAPCLVNLASLLPAAYLHGRGALAALEQAVALYRRLAADDPPRHEAGLAYALTVLAGRIVSYHQLAEAIARVMPDSARRPPVTPGWRQRAVDLATEAVAVDRRWVTANPAVLELQLADGLQVLYTTLAVADRPAEAAAALRESTLVRSRLADPASAVATDPDDDRDPADRPAHTTAGARAGVTLFAYLTETDPQRYRADLAEALDQVAAVAAFDQDGLPDREAVLPHWRRLADEDLPAHGPGLVRALALICAIQRNAGLHEAAARTSEESERWAARIAAVEEKKERRRQAPRIPWGTAEEIDREARRLTAAGDGAALWTLALSVPLADGIRLARALLQHLPPPGAAARSLAERLAAAQPPAFPSPAAVAAPRTALPTYYGDGEGISFAHGRPALTLRGIQADGSWGISALDLTSGRLRRLHRGDRHEWMSVACLGPRLAVGLRGLPHPPDLELVLLGRGREQRLAWGDALRGARVAATAGGYVVGLGLMRSVLVGEGGDFPVSVPLADTGLRRCDRLAVDPTGTRIALADGHRIVVAALPGARVIAAADSAGALEPVFLGPDRLFTAGANGGLRRWELHGDELLPAGEVATPILEQLFAVPAWRVVGGWALARPHFFDPWTLRPVPEPPATAAFQEPTMTWKPSTDGRFVAHGGWPPQSEAQDGPRTVHHDLHHPLAWLARPAAAITPADLPALEDAARRADRRLRPLLRLLRDVCVHRRLPGPAAG
ncbi:hypothetical protein GCM10010495_59110 [Kitasatospora herbaricolor]|uniref:hypothetical protein n=1 Tax=Kitasatospora herbaricolor TaxID=68217 RepID=UPI00174DEA05|nr:hypothetical protein [Kitasatospora herbaricolor]MDQ0306495.1 tetratricopeptide (TPR) repeat protein [Kitasatospora herbaricolor]GGV34375.1 hypothetical protein GCM10010495_59110 [Kitasatospora herbaricolor]